MGMIGGAKEAPKQIGQGGATEPASGAPAGEPPKS